MTRLRLVLLCAGAAFFALLVARIGPEAITSAFGRLSWRLLVLVWFPFALGNVCDTLGWRFALPRRSIPFGALFVARLGGEAFNATTPTASVGGETVKVALIRDHVDYREGVVSVIAAKTTITVSQVLFGAVGWVLLLLAPLEADPLLVRTLGWALVIEGLAVSGFVAVQLAGLVGGAGRLLVRLGIVTGHAGPEGSRRIDEGLATFYRRQPWRLGLSVGFHFLGWAISALETYAILLCLGEPVQLVTAIVIEAAGTAVRFASFMVPAHLGALEGGYVATFVMLGLDAGAGLSFSLVRRIREAAWAGLGVLLLALVRAKRSPRPIGEPLEAATIGEP
ncbi:MAG: flippase-like domain-containing protein [Candidatus Rokubacteria bacterium]|nr:flippase-like domain-containing protein [Candidatus Rokubacteria bacterium]